MLNPIRHHTPMTSLIFVTLDNFMTYMMLNMKHNIFISQLRLQVLSIFYFIICFIGLFPVGYSIIEVRLFLKMLNF